MAAARDSMFVFAPEDSLYGVSVSVSAGTFERLKRGEAVGGYFVVAAAGAGSRQRLPERAPEAVAPSRTSAKRRRLRLLRRQICPVF